MVIGMRLATGQRADDLVGVHVGRRTRAGLEDVDRELVVVLTGGDGLTGGGDLRGQRLVDVAELRVDQGGGALDATEPMDDGQRDGLTGDREVVHGLLGLAAVQRLLLHRGHGPGAYDAAAARVIPTDAVPGTRIVSRP